MRTRVALTLAAGLLIVCGDAVLAEEAQELSGSTSQDQVQAVSQEGSGPSPAPEGASDEAADDPLVEDPDLASTCTGVPWLPQFLFRLAAPIVGILPPCPQ